MILKKIKQVINEFRERSDNLKAAEEITQNQNAELLWANIYHDTIRDRKWLQDISLSPGRWAVNYSFLYFLTRILTDCKPNKIIEFGLGESSKIIASFLQNELQNSSHLIVEQSIDWIDSFSSRFQLSKNSNILYLEMEKQIINGFSVNAYKGIKEKINDTFDLYVIDGPLGSDRYSRYDIISLAEKLDKKNEFIIIIDDFNRRGEQDTAADLIALLNKKGIQTFNGRYSGDKAQIIIVTQKYKYVITM